MHTFFVPVSQVSFLTFDVVTWNALRLEGWIFQRGVGTDKTESEASRRSRQGRQNQQRGDRAVNQAQSVHPHSPEQRSDGQQVKTPVCREGGL